MKSKGQWSKKARNKKRKIKNSKSLNQPQATGICVRVVIKKPKKPNSASRKVAKIKLSSSISPAAQRKGIFNNPAPLRKAASIEAYIPGEGHNLKEHAMVKIRGGRVKDLPGVKYKCIRGSLDLAAVPQRKQARSKYGTPKK